MKLEYGPIYFVTVVTVHVDKNRLEAAKQNCPPRPCAFFWRERLPFLTKSIELMCDRLTRYFRCTYLNGGRLLGALTSKHMVEVCTNHTNMKSALACTALLKNQKGTWVSSYETLRLRTRQANRLTLKKCFLLLFFSYLIF